MTSRTTHVTQVAGHIFDLLLERFPLETAIDPRPAADKLGIAVRDNGTGDLPNGDDFDGFLRATVDWLARDGSVRCEHEGDLKAVTITVKGSAIRDGIPPIVRR